MNLGNLKKSKKVVVIFSLLFVVFITASWVVFSGNEEAAEKQEDSSEDMRDKGQVVPPENGGEENDLDETAKRELEWKEKEASLREELGKFFVPLPSLEELEEEPSQVKARGVYLTGHTAGRESRLDHFIELANTTELNSLVIDVKDDHGHVTYPSNIDFVEEINADRKAPISDLQELVDELHQNDIYTIARVVVFKDSFLPEKYPEWAIQRKNGEGIWRDSSNHGWVNPYQKEIWDYNIAVAKEAALMGFQEIQFDYVRFPDDARNIEEEVSYPGNDDAPKDQNIAEFLEYARSRLDNYNVHISADTFGVIATSWGDSDDIGQTWEKIAPLVDYHSPMIYPSHYGYGYFGLEVPDAHPEKTVTRALEDSLKRNAPIEEPGIIRPWLQAFTAPWIRGNISYGPEEIRKQIEAAYKLGIEEYLLWNPGNSYPEAAFISEEETEEMIERFEKQREEKGHDALGHSPQDATEKFLEGVKTSDWREAYYFHSTDFGKDHHQYEEWKDNWVPQIEDYEISTYDQQGSRGKVEIDVSLQYEDETYDLEDQSWEVVMENKLWRVIPSTEFLEKLEGNFPH